MNIMVRYGFSTLAFLSLCACVPKPIYYWGNYETAIHDRMVDHNAVKGDEHLKETIDEAEEEKLKVPPGLYADYGFMLYRQGKMDSAIAYFDKEKKAFPESNQLMTKLIDKIRDKNKPAPKSVSSPVSEK